METQDQERLKYSIYRVINDIDDMIYTGSTRQKLSRRMDGHKQDAKEGTKPIATHIREIGPEHFTIKLIKQITVSSHKEARVVEQEEIEKVPTHLSLNVLRAYSFDREKTRDMTIRRASRRDFYHRHMQDPEWRNKERERNRERMRKKRAERVICEYCGNDVVKTRLKKHQDGVRCHYYLTKLFA